MSRNFIANIPRYFEPYVNDCLSNVISSYILYQHFNPNIIMADYLSFIYDQKTGYIGLNYIYKPQITIKFTEEESNTALHFFHFTTIMRFTTGNPISSNPPRPDKINGIRYIDPEPGQASRRLKELIDQGIPTLIAVDMFYMRYHQAYLKEHGLHYVIITGYDEDEGYYELFDKYQLANCDFDGKLPIDEINMARASDNPHQDVINGQYVRPIMNHWIEINMDDGFKINNEDLYFIISESRERMTGRKTVLGYQCGLEMLDVFRKDLAAKKAEGLNELNLYLFKSYFKEAFKVLARNRHRFKMFLNELSSIIPEGLRFEAMNGLDETAKCWDICANLSYKLAISKKMELIDNIEQQIGKIITRESSIVNRFHGLNG